MSSKGQFFEIASMRMENNDLKETIKKENKIGKTNEFRKGMIELNLIKKIEDYENNKGAMVNLKYLSDEKYRQVEKQKIAIAEAESFTTTLTSDEKKHDKERTENQEK